MIDVDHQITSTRRAVAAGERAGADVRTMTIERTYDAPVDDVWSACTDPERIPRWFLPVTGELQVGGRYQLEGNAGGTVLSCDPPHRFEATWEFGGTVSWIAVSLSPDGGSADRTRFTLSHTAPVDAHWEQFGPGAVGVGWDLGLNGLYLHLASGGESVDPAAFAEWSASEEGIRFARLSGEAWGEAHVAGGSASAEEAAVQAARTIEAYTGG